MRAARACVPACTCLRARVDICVAGRVGEGSASAAVFVCARTLDDASAETVSASVPTRPSYRRPMCISKKGASTTVFCGDLQHIRRRARGKTGSGAGGGGVPGISGRADVASPRRSAPPNGGESRVRAEIASAVSLVASEAIACRILAGWASATVANAHTSVATVKALSMLGQDACISIRCTRTGVNPIRRPASAQVAARAQTAARRSVRYLIMKIRVESRLPMLPASGSHSFSGADVAVDRMHIWYALSAFDAGLASGKRRYCSLRVDFGARVLDGSVRAHVRRDGPDHSVLVLDTRDLTITAVCDQSGEPLEYALGEPHAVFGAALSVTLKESTSEVEVKYCTSPDAVAIQVPLGRAGRSHA